jgi:hypothetical protein
MKPPPSGWSKWGLKVDTDKERGVQEEEESCAGQYEVEVKHGPF